MKWKPSAKVTMTNGKTGTIKFRDSGGSGPERYVVTGDDGKEYYPTETGITGYAEDAPKKKGWFGR